jgi:protein associated with RNAse G/E
VTTAPVRHARAVEAVDLDLDVIRLRDGSVRVLDEDEFADHQVRYRYPAEVIERAQGSCDDLVRRITAGEEPFVRTAAAWLERFARS